VDVGSRKDRKVRGICSWVAFALVARESVKGRWKCKVLVQGEGILIVTTTAPGRDANPECGC
jgi:hypothetical protein